MSRDEGRLRLAADGLILLGAGHTVLVMSTGGAAALRRWARQGLWATVSLGPGGPAGPTVPQLKDRVTFWAGIGSFAVPTVVLGFLVRHLVASGEPVPRWLGWTLVAWCGTAGVILVPSPWLLGAVAGGLVVATGGEQALGGRSSMP